jgi:hypothetical protein
MRKILATLIIAGLLSATSVASTFADGNYYGMSVFNPFWPIATALSIPASIIARVVDPGARVPVILPTLATPAPAEYSQPAPAEYSQPAPAVYSRPAPVVYSRPAPVVYSRPAPYYAPGPYYAPRVYVGPRGYYAPRAYYPYGGYVVYGRGW